MRILWKSHPYKPELNGTIEHVARELATVAVGYGQAEYAPYKNYIERLQAEEAQRQAAIPANERQVFSEFPVWQVAYLKLANKYVVERLHGTEKISYGEIPIFNRGIPDFKASEKQFVQVLKDAGCPPSVIQNWQHERNKPDYLYMEQQRIEQEKQEAAMQRERERNSVRFV
jgi:hypothetical protein